MPPVPPAPAELTPITPFSPLHSRPLDQWDDLDRDVHAACNGSPLTSGRGLIRGDKLAEAMRKAAEWDATADIRKGFANRKTEELDKKERMKAPAAVCRFPVAKPQAGTCPGCLQPHGDSGRQWNGGIVCKTCHTKATASPEGFGFTLSRAVRWQTAAEVSA